MLAVIFSKEALVIIIDFINEFILAAGATLTGAMLGQQTVDLPSKGVWVLAIVFGLMAGARTVKEVLKVMLPPGWVAMRAPTSVLPGGTSSSSGAVVVATKPVSPGGGFVAAPPKSGPTA